LFDAYHVPKLLSQQLLPFGRFGDELEELTFGVELFVLLSVWRGQSACALRTVRGVHFQPSSSRVHRVLARLHFRSDFALGFRCSWFADGPSFSSGRPDPARTVRLVFADGPFFSVRLWWFCWLLWTVRGTWPDGPRGPCGLSAAPGRTVRVARADNPPLLAGQSAKAWQLFSFVRFLPSFFRASACASRNRS
jgi:hypothetical protein